MRQIPTLAALLSIKTLQSGSFGQTLKNFQQRIDSQGKLQTGNITDDDSIVTYKNDLFANSEDLQNILNNAITEDDLHNNIHKAKYILRKTIPIELV